MEIEKEKLKSFLLDLDLLTSKELEEIERRASENNQKIEELLVSEEILEEEKIARIKAHILGIPFINLKEANISSETLQTISESFARANKVVPFKKKDSNLEIAMLNPGNLEIIETIKKSTGLNVLPRLATSQGINNVLSQYQDSLEAEVDEIVSSSEGEVRVIDEDEEESKNELEKAAKELPVIKIVDVIIKHAILKRASDIHIEPQEEEVIVRYRVDGILRDMMKLPIKISSGIVARIKVLSNLKLDEHRLPQDGRFKVQKKDYKYSLRVSILPVSSGEKIVMRLLPEDQEALSFKEAGIQGGALHKLKEALKKRAGMILVTGPTGSGKTTTLYSVLSKLNTPKVNISTIEDPIEYQVSRINQTQVKPKIGFTFASGLRALVRQDPDVLMVGEIRDGETAKLATNAALTGHLVLSTLHTTSAAGAASRLIDMGVEPFLVSSTVNIIIAQRLLRKLYSSKEGYYLSDNEVNDLKEYCDLDKIVNILKQKGEIREDETIRDVEFFKPVETEKAPDGYRGRIGAFEVLEVSEEIKDLVVSRASSSKIKQKAREEGMITMLEDGIIKAAQGITSIEEVLRVLTE
ncbi:MAG: GspE/PulE family protein [Patescibacteria group bacterium]